MIHAGAGDLGARGEGAAIRVALAADAGGRPDVEAALAGSEISLEVVVDPVAAAGEGLGWLEGADIILIDSPGPSVAGISLLVRLRRQSGVPMILLLPEGAADQAVLALELGADDVVLEPAARGELAARVRSVVRRSRREGLPKPVLDFGPLTVHMDEREVRVEGELVPTTPLEFDLLARLASFPRRVFHRRELLEQVWGSSREWQSEATVTEHVHRLRRKIERNPDRPRWLRTVRGVGYRFDP